MLLFSSDWKSNNHANKLLTDAKGREIDILNNLGHARFLCQHPSDTVATHLAINRSRVAFPLPPYVIRIKLIVQEVITLVNKQRNPVTSLLVNSQERQKR